MRTCNAARLGRPATCIAVAALMAGFVPSLPAPAFADEADAKAIFKAMSDYMAAQTNLSFAFESSLEVVTPEDQKLTIVSTGTVAAERPGRVHAVRHGGFATIEMTYDGNKLWLYNKDANVYSETDLPGDIAILIDTMRDTFGHPLPAADLLLPDIEGTLMPLVTDVKDLGSGVIMGEECDHIAFRTEEVDWQLWVAQGEAKHPCRLVITSKTVKGFPDYSIDIFDWGKEGATANFAFTPPDGAKRVEQKDVPDVDDIAGIYVAK